MTKLKTELEKLEAMDLEDLKESFDEAKFDEDVLSGKEISLDLLNEYKKKEDLPDQNPKKSPDENGFSNGHGLSFRASFKNGQWVGIGSNGQTIKSKNIDDFHQQLAQIFKSHAQKNGKEPECTLRVGEKEKNKEKLMESFARNFINAGVVVKGDLPQSPEFWQTLKQNYLNQQGHDIKTWNRLTRFVPKEYMQSKEHLSQYQTGMNKQPPSQQKNVLLAMINKMRRGR